MWFVLSIFLKVKWCCSHRKRWKKNLRFWNSSSRIDLTTTSRLTKRIDWEKASRISTTTIFRIDRTFASRRFRRSCSWIDWKNASKSTRKLKNESRWINATTMRKRIKKKKNIKAFLKFLFRQQSWQLSSLSSSSSTSSSSSSLKKTNTRIASIILKISTLCLFILSSSLLLFRR